MKRNEETWYAMGPAQIATVENGCARTWLVSAWPLSGSVPELAPGIYDLPVHPVHDGARQRTMAEIPEHERARLAQAATANLEEGAVRVTRLGNHQGERPWTAESVQDAYAALALWYRRDGYRATTAPTHAVTFPTREQAESVVSALRQGDSPAKFNELRIGEAENEFWVYRQDPLRGELLLTWSTPQ